MDAEAMRVCAWKFACQAKIRKQTMKFLAIGTILLAMGCHAHKPAQSYRFRNCKVTQTTNDQNGNDILKDCSCLNAKIIGLDAKTNATIIECR